MAWTETYHCDVCGKSKNGSTDWWLAWGDQFRPVPDTPPQPLLKFTPWNLLLSHDADVRHICGARCAQTMLDRWMNAMSD